MNAKQFNTFRKLESWWQIHEGFGLSFFFCTNQSLVDSLAQAVQTEIAQLSELKFIKGDLEIDLSRSAPRTLYWLEPSKSDLYLVLKRLNESRTALIKKGHLFLLCVPSDEVGEIDALAPDLWSVRSYVFKDRDDIPDMTVR